MIKQGRFAEGQNELGISYALNKDNYIVTIRLGHAHFLLSDPETARKYYSEAIPKIPDEENFEEQYVKDFELFIKNGWQPEESRHMQEWIREEYRKVQKEKKQNEPGFAAVSTRIHRIKGFTKIFQARLSEL